MKGFFRSKLVLTLTAFVLLVGAIAVPFLSPILYSHGASPQASWNTVPSPNSGAGNADTLNAVAKISATDVWAVGFHGYSTLTKHWNGSAWSIVPSPNVGQSQLFGVAAVSANDVWAVGTKTTNTYNDPQTLVMHWDGTSWSVVDSPNPASYINRLHAVTVVSSNDIWAAGEKADFSTSADPRQFAHYQTLIEHWDGTSWTAVASPNGLTDQSSLFGITAISATDIWAVGTYACGSIQTLTLHYNGTDWSIVTSPSVGTSNCLQYNPGIDSILAGVTATASNDVWAVGSARVQYSSNTTSITMHWDGAQWTIVNSPNVTNTPTYLRGTTAVSANDVWAVGDSEPSTGSQTLTMHYDGTSWTIVSSPSPSSNSIFFGTVAVDTNDVWAVGNDSSSGSLIEQYTPPPTPTPTPSPIVTPTPSPTPTPSGQEQATCLGTNTTTPTCYSRIYSGYISTGRTNHPVKYNDVKGSWVVPAAKCSSLEASDSAFWVGLGAASRGTLQQIGTNTGCGGTGNVCSPLTLPGIPAYCAFYQMFPNKSAHIIILANNHKLAVIKPGDTIQAEVTYKENGNFLLQIHDLTQKWDYSNTDNQSGSQLDTAREDADWIAEAPSSGSIQPLTDFTTVGFFKCSADNKPINRAGLITGQFVMTDNGMPTGSFKASPSTLSQSGTRFNVNWVSSGY